ncbi:MAG TPA: MarR family transcriptional regulator [Labilithrix sp.]|jgi:DNA-binding MarR family transcriptional regulator
MKLERPPVLEVFATLCEAAHDLERIVQSPTGAVFRPTPAQLRLLRALDCAGQPFSIADLAKRLGCSGANASDMAARLVRVGWIVRVDNPRVRTRAVAITEKGQWVLDTAIGRVGPALEEAIGMFTARELRTLLRYLRRLSKAAGRHDMQLDPVALGQAEMGPPSRRDEIRERDRRAWLQALKMSQCWGISLEEMRRMGYRIPDRPGGTVSGGSDARPS